MKTALNLTILTILNQVMDLQVVATPTNLTILTRQLDNLPKLLPHPIRPSTLPHRRWLVVQVSRPAAPSHPPIYLAPLSLEASAGGLHSPRLLLRRTVRESRSGVPPLFRARCTLLGPWNVSLLAVCGITLRLTGRFAILIFLSWTSTSGPKRKTGKQKPETGD